MWGESCIGQDVYEEYLSIQRRIKELRNKIAELQAVQLELAEREANLLSILGKYGEIIYGHYIPDKETESVS